MRLKAQWILVTVILAAAPSFANIGEQLRPLFPAFDNISSGGEGGGSLDYLQFPSGDRIVCQGENRQEFYDKALRQLFSTQERVINEEAKKIDFQTKKTIEELYQSPNRHLFYSELYKKNPQLHGKIEQLLRRVRDRLAAIKISSQKIWHANAFRLETPSSSRGLQYLIVNRGVSCQLEPAPTFIEEDLSTTAQ